jgi:hypothetical protein
MVLLTRFYLGGSRETYFLKKPTDGFRPPGGLVFTIDFIADGGGAVLTTGIKGYLKVDFPCIISEVSLLADQTGSIVIDIGKCTLGQFDAGTTHPAFPGDSITASATPTISSSTKYDDGTLAGWTTVINAGDILGYQVKTTPTNISRVTVALKVTRIDT